MAYMDTSFTESRILVMRRLWKLTAQEGRLFEMLLENKEITTGDISTALEFNNKKQVHVVMNHLRKKLVGVATITNAHAAGYWIEDDGKRQRLLALLRSQNAEIAGAAQTTDVNGG
jgi:hypothetical protein